MSTNMLLSIVVLAILLLIQVNAETFITYEPGSTADCGTDEANPCSPVHWDQIADACAATNPLQQSPINIVSTSVTKSPYMFGPVPDSEDGGCKDWSQAVESSSVNIAFAGKCENLFLHLDGWKYILQGVHFHSVSEHAIGGGRYDAEAHFVHKHFGANNTVNILVVGVFLRANRLAGTDHPFLTKILDEFATYGYHTEIDVTSSYSINPYASFTPAKPAQFHYTGSLTRPPCTNNVKWYVFEEPVFISYENLVALREYGRNASGIDREIVDEHGNNNRPLQTVLADTEIYYIPGGAVDTPSPTLAPVTPTSAPSQHHRMPQNALIVGSVAVALSGVLLVVTIVLFFIVAKNHTVSLANEVGEGSEQLL